MTKRRSYSQRRARYLQRGQNFKLMAEDLAGVDTVVFVDGDQEPLIRGTVEYVRYRDWLMAAATAKGDGPRMRRALIRAEQRYSRLQREYRGTSRLRRNYPTRWRR
jgi:hypothetical protein